MFKIGAKTVWLGSLLVALAGCEEDRQPALTVVDTPGTVAIKGEVWADNWFAFYLGDQLIVEDSTPVTTERSFNAEAFVFNADYPLQLNFVVRDFKEKRHGARIHRRGQSADGRWRFHRPIHRCPHGRRHCGVERGLALPGRARGPSRPFLRRGSEPYCWRRALCLPGDA